MWQRFVDKHRFLRLFLGLSLSAETASGQVKTCTALEEDELKALCEYVRDPMLL